MSDTTPITPAGFTVIVDGETYEFNNKLRAQEVIAMESATGMTFDQWSASLQAGSMAALVALIWLLKRRKDPRVKFKDVDFDLDALEFVTPVEATEADVPTEAAADA